MRRHRLSRRRGNTWSYIHTKTRRGVEGKPANPREGARERERRGKGTPEALVQLGFYPSFVSFYSIDITIRARESAVQLKPTLQLYWFTLTKLQWPRCNWEFQWRGAGCSVKFNWLPVNFHWFPVEFHWISCGIPLNSFPVSPGSLNNNHWPLTGSC